MAPKDPYRYFRGEARELLDGLRRGTAELENAGGDPARIALLLRLAHTLKGAARVVKLPTVSEFAHRLEDVLASLRDTAGTPTRGQLAELQRIIAAIGAGLERIEQPAGRPPAAEAAASPPRGAIAPVASLDTVSLQVAEMDAVLAEAAGTSGEVAALQADTRELRALGKRVRRLAFTSRAGNLAPAMREVADLAATADRLQARLGNRAERLERDLQRVQEDIGRLRLLPTDALWTFLERVAHDAAQALGRNVRFEPAGRVARIDATVFTLLREALQHLVRNAVAHGLEPEAERLASGKPPVGKVCVRLAHNRGRLRVECEDDGRGIDIDAVGRAAIAKGWLEAAAWPLDMETAVRLLLRGGVTTAAVATELAGRGVGLDIVRAALARLGGELTLRSTAGRGTVVALDVPTALSAGVMLGVESGDARLLIPLDAVQRVARAEVKWIHPSPAGEQLHLDRETIPYAPLHRLISRRPAAARESGRHRSVVIIRDGDDRVAVGVDRLLGTIEAVVRPLPLLADAAAFVSGVAPAADGPPRLVLDPRELGAAIRSAAAQPATLEPVRPPILVVDDSLTTRMLEQSILESAGYSVDLAVSGEDAWRRLQERRYGLVLVDVEMPGMDGFTFLERLRADAAWRALPAILVTSRDSSEDRRRGLAAGAQDYVTKGEFDQRRLLRRIEELLS